MSFADLYFLGRCKDPNLRSLNNLRLSVEVEINGKKIILKDH